MFSQTIALYCICDEVVKSLNIKDDEQCKMSTSEVMTFAIMSAILFGCDYRRMCLIARNYRYFTKILSHSRLVRRIHQIPEHVWMLVFGALRVLLKTQDNQYFIVDSFPVKTYENHKSFRARIFSDKKYHGYSASKKQYFFGIKVHMIIDAQGVPIEFSFTPGSESDITTLQNFTLDLPEKSILMGDRAYTSYAFEDSLLDLEKIKLLVKRRVNSKRKNTKSEESLLKYHRNSIETVFSSIVSRMPRYLKARTEKGFYLKIMFFILAYMMNLHFPLS